MSIKIVDLKKNENKCGIYCIEVISGNPKKIGWKYIGQSIDCSFRWSSHLSLLKRRKHFNKKLQRYYNKYGPISFVFSILEMCQSDELNDLEIKYIQKFNSINNGLNVLEGGQIKNAALKRTCTLKNIVTKETVTCNSLAEFARIYDISANTISNLLNGKRNYSNNWYNPYGLWQPTYYNVISPNGEKYELTHKNIMLFCKEHNINNYPSFNQMVKGKLQFSQGWSRLDSVKLDSNRYRYSTFKFINKKGDVVEGENLSKFSRDSNLLQSNLRAVLIGRRKSHRGWKLYREEKYVN